MAANSFGFNGFTPYRHLSGGVVRAEEMNIATSGTTGFNDNIFYGDVVKLNTDGTIESAAGGDTNLVGIFAGCQYEAADGSIKFSKNWVASTAVKTGSKIKATVFADPDISFLVTSDASVVSAQAQIGSNVDFVAGTGNSATGVSGSYVDLNTSGNGAANFRVLSFPDMPGNIVGNTKTRVEVKFAEHLRLTAAGI
jgi:hypothetical protein